MMSCSVAPPRSDWNTRGALCDSHASIRSQIISMCTPRASSAFEFASSCLLQNGEGPNRRVGVAVASIHRPRTLRRVVLVVLENIVLRFRHPIPDLTSHL